MNLYENVKHNWVLKKHEVDITRSLGCWNYSEKSIWLGELIRSKLLSSTLIVFFYK